MKSKRQEKILEIINDNIIETQEQLSEHLKYYGFDSTQATISRDIKELRLVKELTPESKYRYAVARSDSDGEVSDKLYKIFRECVRSVDCAGNILVLKTFPGLAMGACSALDSMQIQAMLGTIAGDDTGVVIMRDNNAAAAFRDEIKKML